MGELLSCAKGELSLSDGINNVPLTQDNHEKQIFY